MFNKPQIDDAKTLYHVFCRVVFNNLHIDDAKTPWHVFCRVVFNNLHIDDAKTPYHAVQHLLLNLLEIELESPHQEREHVLFKTFRDDYILKHLSLLNDLLHVKVSNTEHICFLLYVCYFSSR